MSRTLRRFSADVVLVLLALWLLTTLAHAQTQGSLRPTLFSIDGGTKTATATAGAATLNKMSGIITTESLVTGIGATYTLTLTNSGALASDMVFANVANGTNTTGNPEITTAKPSAGSIQIVVMNGSTTVPFNGNLRITYIVLRN